MYGKIAYEAYAADTIVPTTMPSWEQLTATIRQHWEAAAEAVVDEVIDKPEFVEAEESFPSVVVNINVNIENTTYSLVESVEATVNL